MSGDIVVNLRNGVYYRESTLELNETDGGTNGHNVIYRSYPGETATISGGRVITGWQASGGVFTASTKGLVFRQLYVNDKPAVKARSDGGIGSGSAVEQVLLTGGGWGETYLPLTPSGTVPAGVQANYDALVSFNGVLTGSPIGYRNSPSYINSPGQWAIDPSAQTVYYMPRAGEDMATAIAIAPVADPVVLVQGSSLDNMAGNIIFQEIKFAHAAWAGFDTAGFCSVLAGIGIMLDSAGERMYTRMSGGVTVRRAHHIRFEKCEIACMGGIGIDMPIACHDNAITGCSIRDIAGNGIAVAPTGLPRMGADTTRMFNPEDHRLYCENIEVSNNRVTLCAFDYKGGVGILAGFPTAINIRHNEVWNLPYNGIVMGWGARTWQNAMRDNRISGNYVYDCMLELIDGGLVYTQCQQPNSTIDSNFLAYYVGARGNFFYLDIATGGFTVRHNVTKGVSFTFGLGFDCYDMTIDSNYSEWVNYLSSNGTTVNDQTYRVTLTNQFNEISSAIPQGIMDAAGVNEEEIQLTPVSIAPKAKLTHGHFNITQTSQCAVYDLKGRMVCTTSRANSYNLSRIRSGKVMPAGIYLTKVQYGVTKPHKIVVFGDE
jgi:hypothetical protein